MPPPPWSRLGNVATRHCESITVGFWYALAVTGGGRCAWPRRMGVQGGPPGTTRIRSDGRPIGGRVFAGDRQCRSGLGVPRHGNPSGQPRLHPGLRRPSSENRVYRGALSGRGAVTSRDYKVIGHLRAFRDNTPSGSTVATHELIADYEAIVLADDVTASNILPSGRALESRPGVVLHPGQAVCHFGVSTGETCGTVESVNNGWFTMSHGVLSEKGDSGPGLPGPRWRPRADRRDLQQRLGRLSRGGVLAVDVRAGSRGSRRDAPCLASTPLAATRLIAVCLLER